MATAPIMTPDTSSPRSEKPTPKSSRNSQTAARKAKPSHRTSTDSLRQSSGTNALGPMPGQTTAEGSCSSHPCQLGAGRAPGRSTNQGPPSTISKAGPAGVTPIEHLHHLRSPTFHESQWDEGTVYGRLASLNCQPTDRDAVYCDRATQAISDFKKKFR